MSLFPQHLDCVSLEDGETGVCIPQHRVECEHSAGTLWFRACFLLLYFYYLIEGDSVRHKLRPWNQGTLGSYINLRHLGLIYLLFQYTELAVASITPSDSPKKCNASSTFFWLCSFSYDLLEAVERNWKGGVFLMLCQLLEPESENSRRTRIPFVIHLKKRRMFL